MATVLYKEGDSHKHRGVKCDILVTEYDIGPSLAQGWVMDVHELYGGAEIGEDGTPITAG